MSNDKTKVENKTEQKEKVETSEKKNFIQNLVDSVVNVGFNKHIHNFFRVIFVLAILSSLVLVFLSGFNIHTIVLTFLISGLFASVELFNYQLNEIKKEQEMNEKNTEEKKNE